MNPQIEMYFRNKENPINLEFALKKLTARISSGNFTPTQHDADCLTFLKMWIFREKENTMADTMFHYFGKLYLEVFIEKINHYKDIDFAQKKISELLNQDFSLSVSNFKKDLNTFELEQFYKENKFNGIDFFGKTTKEMRENDNEILSKIDKDEFFKITAGKWQDNEIIDKLNETLTETFNRLKTKPNGFNANNN